MKRIFIIQKLIRLMIILKKNIKNKILNKFKKKIN
jgi:hypothetical protein